MYSIHSLKEYYDRQYKLAIFNIVTRYIPLECKQCNPHHSHVNLTFPCTSDHGRIYTHIQCIPVLNPLTCLHLRAWPAR